MHQIKKKLLIVIRKKVNIGNLAILRCMYSSLLFQVNIPSLEKL